MLNKIITRMVCIALATLVVMVMPEQLRAQSAQSTELIALINKGAYLVDVRTPEEFAEGSVTGAVNIPLDEIENQIAQFKDKKHIVVFCKSGYRAGEAKELLAKHGFTNVSNAGSWEDVAKLKK
ncbi:MAG: rhodanese-like domain-containing protein [Saprospiraceae bacterium]|nr:rhodanese-like domain-containing protein [Saprospiraceae bacterium]MBP7679897.1 rhodanese-like domain-containing protein [Saprospiraceae bacterium]